ncbi:MAG TPA: CPBP family intramembrane glutamic endopeptidase [Symbiobacteriaceae bacterium]|jgi:membrane protease YdiL (CAAX protease family)
MSERHRLIVEWLAMLAAFFLVAAANTLIGLPSDSPWVGILFEVELVAVVGTVLLSTKRLRTWSSILWKGTSAEFFYWALLIGLVGSVVANLPMAHGGNPQSLSIAFDSIAIAPVVEELIFRGYILWSAERAFGTSAGVALSSILFAAAHVPGGLATVLSSVVIGLCFAVLTVKAKSLVPAVVGHVSFNLVPLVLVLVRAS